MTVISLPRRPLVHATSERAGCLLSIDGDADAVNGAEVTCPQCQDLMRATRMRNALPERRMIVGGKLRKKSR